MHADVVNRAELSSAKFSSEKQNFFKAHLALDFTRLGLKDFVKDGITTVHQGIMQTLSQRTPCVSCTITNVVPCPTRGLCKGRTCQMHSISPCRQCPNTFCNSFMSEIKRVHAYNMPTWQNTDTKGLSTDPWQIAKCFCPPGFDKYTSADNTDLPGLIHVITNCTVFQAKIAENLEVPGNIFHQVRDSRNQINHSATLEMPEPVLLDHIKKMTDILKDPAFLLNHSPAKEAVENLDKLKHEPLFLTEDEERQINLQARKKYEEDKKCLQSHLADQYLTLYSKISLSPLVSEIVADFDDIAVPQSMEQVKLSHETENEGKQQETEHEDPERTAVESFEDSFTRKSHECKHIYIKGEPGAGKSFLSQRIVLSWSKGMKGEHIVDDEHFIKRFSFLFYISLRYTRNENKLDEMILKHPLLECDKFDDLIKRILRDESSKCLIVLDGLDEWSFTQTIATLGISKGLPLRDVTRRYTIITTTRPWKMEAIRMTPTEIDQLIELTGMDEDSSEEYIDLLVRRLNKRFGLDKAAGDFIEVLQSHNLGAFMTLPVLLKYLVCLWHAGKPIGNSQCEIYSGLVDLLLELPVKESACRNQALESQKQTSTAVKLPLCFNGKNNCHLFGSLLQRLSKLAFHTLFAENQESSIVFDSSSAEIHGMSKTDIQDCLNIGILSQDIVLEQCAIPEMSISFIHKTFQEFLAAVYVYMLPDQIDSIYITITKYCSSVEKLLEISTVLVFMSGICPAMVTRLSEHVAGVVSQDKLVQIYRHTVDYRQNATVGYRFREDYPGILRSVQIMMTDSIKEAHCASLSQDLNIYIQDVVYGPETAHDQQLIQSSNGYIKSIFISGIGSLDMLQHVTQIGVLQKLAVESDDDDEEDIPLARITSIIHKNRDSIKCLVLGNITCYDMSLETLPLFEHLYDLEGIKIYNTSFSREQNALLMSYLSRRTGLRMIHLLDLKDAEAESESKSEWEFLESCVYESESECTEDQCVPHSHSPCTVSESGYGPLDLTSHTQLTTLELQNVHTDYIEMPTSCPQFSTLLLSTLSTGHIQMTTSCPQWTELNLTNIRTDHFLMPTFCPKLITLRIWILEADRIQLPASCPQMTRLELLELRTKHIQMPTSCPQLITIDIKGLYSDHIQIPTSYPQVTQFKLEYVYTDHTPMPTSCPQLTTLVLIDVHGKSIQMPTSCPKLTSLDLMSLHTDSMQLPTDISHVQWCRLIAIDSCDGIVSIIQALRHSSHLQVLNASLYEDDIPEIADTMVDILPTLHQLRDLEISCLHVGGRQLRLSSLMTHLVKIELCDVTLCLESFHNFIDSIVEIPQTLKVELMPVTITPDEDTGQALDYIRSSSRCVVTENDRDCVKFYTTDQTSQ